MPKLYKFVLASHSCEAKLMFGEHSVLSHEGSQQGDPLSALEFCDAIHPTLQKCEAGTKLGYIDDVKLKRQFQVVASDVKAIIDAYSETALRLNPSKCEIVCLNFDILNDDLTLLEVPVQKGKAVDKALEHQDHRTQTGYRTAVFITRTRRTLSFT